MKKITELFNSLEVELVKKNLGNLVMLVLALSLYYDYNNINRISIFG